MSLASGPGFVAIVGGAGLSVTVGKTASLCVLRCSSLIQVGDLKLRKL